MRERLARRGARRAELADERPRLRVVDVDDAEGEPRPDQRARQPQLDEPARVCRAPGSGDPVVRRAAAVVERQPRRHRPVAARVDREAQELVVGGDDCDPDLVAQGGFGPLGVAEHHAVVLHLEEHVDAGAVAADPVAERERRLSLDGRCRLDGRRHTRLVPVRRASVDDDRSIEVGHAQVALGARRHRVDLAREQHVRPVVERGRHRPRRGDETLLLHAQQEPLELAHVEKAHPGDQQQQARDEQQLRRDREPRPRQAQGVSPPASGSPCRRRSRCGRRRGRAPRASCGSA